MDYEEKSRIINKICACGFYDQIKLPKIGINDIFFIRNDLLCKEKQYLDYIYRINYEKAIEVGMPKEEKMVEQLIEKGKFPKDWKEQIEQAREKSKEFKLDYINHMKDEKAKSTIKRNLVKIEDAIRDLLIKKNCLINGLSADAYALECQIRCKYVKMVVHEDNNITEEEALTYDFKNEIERIIFQNRIESEQVRLIARTNPWRLLWTAGQKQVEAVFGRLAKDLTEEQVELCYWTRFYDSIYDAYERPSEEIIEDNLALDSWYENRILKENRESLKKSLVGKSVEKCKEVFIKTSPEGVNKVYEANDPSVRNAMRQRDKIIAGSGKIKESEIIKKQGRSTADLFVNQSKKKGR